MFAAFLYGLFTVAEGRNGRHKMVTRRSGGPVRLSSSARQATRRAGYSGGPNYVNVTDIGLLAYRSMAEPKLVRGHRVLADTRFLRPFAELWVPYQSRGAVRFELIDGEGRMRYADEAWYDLNPGQNTLLPGTWLPLEGKAIVPGTWRLRLQAGGVLLADHAFEWAELGNEEIRRRMASDGEISPALQAALREQASQAVSLSDLLADQEG